MTLWTYNVEMQCYKIIHNNYTNHLKSEIFKFYKGGKAISIMKGWYLRWNIIQLSNYLVSGVWCQPPTPS